MTARSSQGSVQVGDDALRPADGGRAPQHVFRGVGGAPDDVVVVAVTRGAPHDVVVFAGGAPHDVVAVGGAALGAPDDVVAVGAAALGAPDVVVVLAGARRAEHAAGAPRDVDRPRRREIGE